MRQKTDRLATQEWIFILLCIAVIFIASWLIINAGNKQSSYAPNEAAYDSRLITFDEGWSIKTANFSGSEITLPTVVNAGSNETVTISKKLPAGLTEGTYIRVRSDNAFVKVYIGDELIYSCGSLSQDENNAPEKWNFIKLEEDYSSRTLSISFESPYSYYSKSVPNVVLATLSEVMLYTTAQAALPMYIGICAVAMGIIMLMLSLINTIARSSLRRYAYLSIYIILLGLILITRAQLPRNYDGGYFRDYLIFHIALRICPLMYCMYMYVRVKEKYKKFICVSVYACAVNFVAAAILHFSALYDYSKSLWTALLFMALTIVYGFYFDVADKSAGSFKYRAVMCFGLTVLTFGVAAEVFLRASLYISGQKIVLAAAVLVFAASQSASVMISSFDIATEQLKVQKELDDKKIKLMMSQMQPHFIYNTLNTIRGMTLSEPQKAYEMTYNFSNYLKHNISALGESDIIPFKDELEHIKAYTAIECERFKGKISVVYDIQCVSFLIPPLSIEPFVENAIKHGIRKRSTPGSVTIFTQMRDTHYFISITDDGVGFDTEKLKQGEHEDIGIGIKNAVYRLRELSDAHVDIRSSPGNGCSVSIIIPKVLSEGDLQ